MFRLCSAVGTLEHRNIFGTFSEQIFRYKNYSKVRTRGTTIRI